MEGHYTQAQHINVHTYSEVFLEGGFGNKASIRAATAETHGDKGRAKGQEGKSAISYRCVQREHFAKDCPVTKFLKSQSTNAECEQEASTSAYPSKTESKFCPYHHSSKYDWTECNFLAKCKEEADKFLASMVPPNVHQS